MIMNMSFESQDKDHNIFSSFHPCPFKETCVYTKLSSCTDYKYPDFTSCPDYLEKIKQYHQK